MNNHHPDRAEILQDAKDAEFANSAVQRMHNRRHLMFDFWQADDEIEDFIPYNELMPMIESSFMELNSFMDRYYKQRQAGR